MTKDVKNYVSEDTQEVKISGFKKKVSKVFAVAFSLMMCCLSFVIPASAEEASLDNLSNTLITNLTSVDYMIILEVVVAIIPVVFPALFGLIAVRKGISFALGMFRGV